MYAKKIATRSSEDRFDVLEGTRALGKETVTFPGARRAPAREQVKDDLLEIYFSEIRNTRFLTREEELACGRDIRESRVRLGNLVFSTRFGQEQAIGLIQSLLRKEISIEEAFDVYFDRKGARRSFWKQLEGDAAALGRNFSRNCADLESLGRNATPESLRVGELLRRRAAAGARILNGIGIKDSHVVRWARALVAMAKDLQAADVLAEDRDPFPAHVALQTVKASTFETIDEFLGRAVEIDMQLRRYENAKAALAKANLWLVVNIAKRHQNSGMSLLDLIQEGNAGLLRAAEKYDHRKGNKFSTYATWWIVQSITRGIADRSRTIRLPVHATGLLSKIQRKRCELEGRNGEDPGRKEIAEDLGIEKEEVELILATSVPPRSLHQPCGGDAEGALEDILEDKSALNFTGDHSQEDLKVSMERVLGDLHSKERLVLMMRFGIGQDRSLSVSEIADHFRLSTQRVRQIENRAIEKLRHPSRIGRLEVHLS